MKSILAAAVLALSASVSAQIVYVPDFPVKKSAISETAADAPASAPAASEKAA